LDFPIVSEYDTMCARVYRVKCFNFSNIRIRTDFYIKIRIQRMRTVISFVTSLSVRYANVHFHISLCAILWWHWRTKTFQQNCT